MLNFVLRKMLNKKWMVISLLIGNLLMMAIAAASPMYAQAVLQRTLTQNLGTYLTQNNKNPGTIQVKSSFALSAKDKTAEFRKVTNGAAAFDQMIQKLNSPVLEQVTQYTKNTLKAKPSNGPELLVKLTALTNVEDHIEIAHGQIFSKEVTDNVIEVVVSEKTFVEQNLVLGQDLVLTRLLDENDQPYSLRVVGVFTHKDVQDPYWISSPNYWSDLCLMDVGIFEELIANPDKKSENFDVLWYAVLDYTAMRADNVDNITEVLETYQRSFNKSGIKEITVNFQDVLTNYNKESKKLTTTVWVLQVPIFVLLAAFIFMVSRQMLEMEQNEISVFKSRGASKIQIILIYILQSVLIAALGMLGGIPLGILICNVLGSSNAFLEFVRRASLLTELNSDVWMFTGIAFFFSICTMVLPVLKYANVGIVETKRAKNRKNKLPWWQMIFADVILLGVSIYGLTQFNAQKEYLAQQVLEGASLDPSLYLSSSLFMIGAGLLFLRLFPWVLRLIFWLGKRWWPPSLYASFLRIIRTKDNQGFLMVFLVLTVSLGIFNAQTARTINANAEQQLRYSIGADLVVQEKWSDNSNSITSRKDLAYTEPDFSKYQQMEEVKSATCVLVNNNVSVSLTSGKVSNVKVMGIHTKEFGETAWFKDSLLDLHWYEYLNVISQNSRAVLVSSNFRDNYGYRVGDVITFLNENGDSVRGIIYGFVDYWPSYNAVSNVKDKDGVYKEKDNYLIVAHLAQLQAAWGITPYQVWLDTDGSSQFLYDYAAESGTKYTVFKDTSAELISLKNDPVFQGTNGILTVGFIVVLLLCATGFLIYWILSIQSRTLQFGIFRAMGMSMREVLSMLINEQVFISGSAIGIGVLVGRLSSNLFIPLIQISYSAVDRSMPLEIISESGDFVRLGVVIGLMIVACMAILGVLISRIRISQALKLGED